MSRPRNHTNGDLPRYLHRKHGAVYHVRFGKWTRLGDNVADAIVALGKMMGGNGTVPTRPTAPAGGMMMDELLNAAFPVITVGVKKSTSDKWRGGLRRLCTLLADVSVEQFDTTYIYDMRNGLKNSASVFNNALTVLRLSVAWAKEKKIKIESVVEVKQLEAGQRTRYMTDAEFAAIYAKASPTVQVIMDLCFLTGQRINDVLKITLAHLTDDGIAFHQTKGQDANGRGGTRLVVGWSPELRDAVARAKALRGDDGNVRRINGFLLAGRGTVSLCYDTIHTAWANAVAASGVDDVVMHDLRAKAATDVYLANGGGTVGGAGVAAAQALLGHATPTMTWRYIRDRLTNVVKGPTMRLPKATVVAA